MLSLPKIGFIVLALSLISCSESEEDAAKLLGLEIGNTKSEVIDRLRKNPSVRSIAPSVDEYIVIKRGPRNKNQMIDLILSEPGVMVIGESPKLAISLTLDNTSIKDLYLAPVNKGESLEFKIGMEKGTVKKILLENFDNGRVHRIFNFLPGSEFIILDTMTKKQEFFLMLQNTWVFGETNKHSHVRIKFVNNRLGSIDYKWSPIELP